MTQLSLLDSIDRTPPRKPSGEELRDQGIARAANARSSKEWVRQAQIIARQLGADGREVNINMVRAIFPPWEGVTGQSMAGVLKGREWTFVRYDKSDRKVSHVRQVAYFILNGRAPAKRKSRAA